MKIHHLRNATFVIESGKHHILIDPMLSEKGAMPPYSYFRSSPRKNPIISMPGNAHSVLNKVTLCLVTHSQKLKTKALQHTDHLDRPAMTFLQEKNIPVITIEKDSGYLKKQGINIVASLEYWRPQKKRDIQITAVPAQHGHGWIHHLMANGAGFYVQMTDAPSIYISGDTVYTKDVKRAFIELKPDISVMAAGGARMDIGKPILMSMDELLRFAKEAPGKVIANHLEALNHCPITRKKLKNELYKSNLLSKIFIPEDGETILFETEP